jgi:4-amino-4-deoxy-L-arabinose transferase-like glycosyltransferase
VSSDREIVIRPAIGDPRDRAARVLTLLLIVFYAVGLCRELTSPWIGMHDWNGAFFSQLARNFLRYPFEVHHGLPIVAVGDATPPPEERSVYAGHPPGLVWLLAIYFTFLGDSEWAARLLPIGCSLASLVLLIALLRHRRGNGLALTAGALFAMLPMTVFYGRMVNHEAVVLPMMLLAVLAVSRLERAATASGRWTAAGLCAATLVGAIWVDWVGVLFGALLGSQLAWRAGRRRLPLGPVALVNGAMVLGLLAMVAYLVGYGFDGRIGDLFELYLSRGHTGAPAAPGRAAFQIADNLTLPILALVALGIVRSVLDRRAGRIEPPAGLAVIGVTGAAWMILFWRQFLVHGYWMFYLAPGICYLAARGLLGVRQWTYGVAPARAHLVLVAALLLATIACFLRSAEFFRRQSLSPELVATWRYVHRHTAPDERIVVCREPVRVERHGRHVFRNLTPPQFAYYLDRPFSVGLEPERVLALAGSHQVLLLTGQTAFGNASLARWLMGRYSWQQVGSDYVFALSP